MTSRRLPLLALLVAMLFLLPSAVQFYADWLWFAEVGFQPVYARSLTTQSMLWLVTFGLTFGVLLVNLRLAFRVLTRREIVMVTPEGPRAIVVDPVRLRPIVTLVSGGGAVLVASIAAAQWETWLVYWHATPFGKVDPVLGYDVGFYVFQLPFWRWLHSLAMLTLALTTVGVGLVYVGAGFLRVSSRRGLQLLPPASTHAAVLAAGWLAIIAAAAWLSIPEMLTAPSGLITGATYVDVHARMPAAWVLVAVATIGILLAGYQVMQARIWPLATAFGLCLLASMGGAIYAAALQRFVVGPNEQAREAPYIVANIAATRDAFALERVQERALSGDAALTRHDIDANAVTLRNVPLWDHQPLKDTFSQIQEIRTYYDFVSVDNDRYLINGEYRQIMLSARELNSDSLPNRNWINEHFTFTHGYGLTLGPVNQVTREGLPTLFIRNLPPESTVDLPVTEPSLYFGELSNDHVFVKTKTREFHYPKADGDVYTEYAGTGGVSIGSFGRKLLFALRFRSMKTLLSDALTSESRILYHRRIADRVRLIAPFLEYDADPYLAIDQGRLFWIQDAYTTSDRYPYAQRAGDINYIRNSIKVVIDAYNGTTTFYAIDPRDPIAATLGRAFPGLLTPVERMPAGLRQRMRYPQTIFAIQAAMFSTYHMDRPDVFYNKEDQWEVPSIGAAGGEQRMEPYYAVMRLPGEKQAEYIQMLPFTPRQKDNLAAWMVSRTDGDHYGDLVVFTFPKQKLIFGPRQVVARINQDQVISPQITLWSQQGSKVIQGTLLVIPIEESLLYVRALYLKAEGGTIPELKRVIVAHQNEIVMEDTLDAAIDRLFGKAGSAGPSPTRADAAEPASAVPVSGSAPTSAASPAPVERPSVAGEAERKALAAEAIAHYERALAAQRDGNWALYGEEIKKLGEVLKKLP
ncbi:MAG: UPF0182 family protein [Vicinamibacteraceae bacterium]